MSLKLIQNYGSSDESSEEESDNNTTKVNNQEDVKLSTTVEVIPKEKLPFPAELENIVPLSSNDENNLDDHGGRIRSFPHVRGNWASFVHVPCM
jgi:hypothetical protein